MADPYPSQAAFRRARATRPGIRWAVLVSSVACAAAVAVAVAPGPGLAQAAGHGARWVTLRSGQLKLRLTAPALAALTEIGSSSGGSAGGSAGGSSGDARALTAITPATHPSGAMFTFPVSRGRLNVANLSGDAVTRGGIRFTNMDYDLGRTFEFTLQRFTMALSAPADLAATFVGDTRYPDVSIATLNVVHARHSIRHGSVSISHIALELTSAGAEAFNLQAGGFRVGETVGSLALAGRVK